MNNVLGAITATASTALEAHSASSPAHQELVDVLEAARRGETLTRNILSFARRGPYSKRPVPCRCRRRQRRDAAQAHATQTHHAHCGLPGCGVLGGRRCGTNRPPAHEPVPQLGRRDRGARTDSGEHSAGSAGRRPSQASSARHRALTSSCPCPMMAEELRRRCCLGCSSRTSPPNWTNSTRASACRWCTAPFSSIAEVSRSGAQCGQGTTVTVSLAHSGTRSR